MSENGQQDHEQDDAQTYIEINGERLPVVRIDLTNGAISGAVPVEPSDDERDNEQVGAWRFGARCRCTMVFHYDARRLRRRRLARTFVRQSVRSLAN